MAFRKTAKALVTTPSVDLTGWNKIRVASNGGIPFSKESARVVLQQYEPTQFLLTHCTIMASVDTEAVKAPLGTQIFDGYQIDRRYADFYIKPKTEQFVNNNNDSWERKLLLACFKTFVGAENYVEHLQIPAMSKGKIIDAASRDIGDSVYIDILVATDRKHKPLVDAITSGKLGTLSMGCFVPGTPVTLANGKRIPIEEVVPGDKVLTHKGRAREVLNKQIRVGKWGMRRVNVVGVPDAIEATDNHPFFVLRPAQTCGCGCGEALTHRDPDPVRRMTKRFVFGHDKRVLNPNGTYSLEEMRERQARMADISAMKLEEVRADELRVGDYVVLPKLQVKASSSPGTAKARLLGYFLAEGSFLKYKGTPTAVEFNFSSAEEHTLVAETVELLKTAFAGSKPWIQHRPERSTCTVHVYGRQIAAWFLKHGGEYASGKNISDTAMRWPVEAQRHILSTWVDGDGTLRAQGSTTGTTTSYALACQMQVIATRLGIPVRLECRFGGQTSTITEAVVGGQAVRHEVTNKLASFNLCIPRSAASSLQGYSTKAPVKSEQARNFRTFGDNVIFPITSIDGFTYEGAVHDMEVDEDHSYLVHGLAVHNCSVQFTLCTKCGNVAYDETQLCPHIRYQKGADFYDELGNKRKIAELCGHVNAEPGSVKFIEASWVANPAFTGAVLRSILTAEEAAQMGPQIMLAHLVEPAPSNATMARAASIDVNGTVHVDSKDFGNLREKTAEFNFDSPGADGAGGDTAQPPAPKESDPIDKLVDDLKGAIRERALKDLRGEIGKGEAEKLQNTINQNETLIKSAETLIKSAFRHPSWRGIARTVYAMTGKNTQVARKVLLGLIMHKAGGWKAVAESRSLDGREVLAVARVLDHAVRRASSAGEARIYRTVITAGGIAKYASRDAYLAECRRLIGRDLTDTEKRALLHKGTLYDLGSRFF